MEFIQNLDTHPRAEIIWNDPDMEEQWGAKVRTARSLHSQLEYDMVKHKIRKCATIHVSPRNYDRFIDRINQDGLYWVPIERTKSYSGFSHKHFSTAKIDMNTNVYGALSYKLEYAEQFREASRSRPVDHGIIGELLGFPKCCSKFFTDVWKEGYYDPVYQSAEKTGEKVAKRTIKVVPHIATQQVIRYVGFRLTSHFACSLDCEESIEVGKKWYDLAESLYPQSLEYLKEIMSLPGKWSVLHGVSIVTTHPFTILANSLPTKKEWQVVWEETKTY